MGIMVGGENENGRGRKKVVGGQNFEKSGSGRNLSPSTFLKRIALNLNNLLLPHRHQKEQSLSWSFRSISYKEGQK